MGNKKGLLKSILPWLIVLMVISVAIPFFNQSESSEIRYDKFIEIVQKRLQGQCHKIVKEVNKKVANYWQDNNNLKIFKIVVR